MIHDAVVEVTCDAEGCRDHVYVQLDYVYGGIAHTDGRYDDDDSKVEKQLVEKHEWEVRDGKHYCSIYCAAH